MKRYTTLAALLLMGAACDAKYAGGPEKLTERPMTSERTWPRRTRRPSDPKPTIMLAKHLANELERRRFMEGPTMDSPLLQQFTEVCINFGSKPEGFEGSVGRASVTCRWRGGGAYGFPVQLRDAQHTVEILRRAADVGARVAVKNPEVPKR